MGFLLSGKILYKKSQRSHDGTLFRCVDAAKARTIPASIHERVCATHASGRIMARQILQAGYY